MIEICFKKNIQYEEGMRNMEMMNTNNLFKRGVLFRKTLKSLRLPLDAFGDQELTVLRGISSVVGTCWLFRMSSLD